MKSKAINSRAKGAAAEREFSRLVLAETGVKLIRNLEQSRGGGHDLEPVGDDPAALALRRFAIECKRYRAITPALLSRFWQQAEAQAARAGRTPCLAYRRDREPWRVVVPLSELNGQSFGEWDGIGWTATVGVEAFCALVRGSITPPPMGKVSHGGVAAGMLGQREEQQ